MNKSWFSFGIFIVILLALAFVFLDQPVPVVSPGGNLPAPVRTYESVEDLKAQEFLGAAPAASLPPEGRNPTLARAGVNLPPGRNSFARTARVRPADSVQNGRRPAFSAFTHKDAPSERARLAGGSASASSAGKGGASFAPETRRAGAVINGGTDTDSYSAANDAILSYMGSKKDRRKQEALRRQMAGVSDAVDRALARAMAPKSKREAMLERYTRRSGPEGAAQAAGPFDSVVSQIASQKDSVVKGMTDSFGASAGRKAGKIMDGFQKEASAAANRKDLSRQEQAGEIRKIHRKYQRQLGELAHDESFNRLEAEQRRENEAYLARLRDKFNPETEQAARAVLDDFTAQKMALMKQGLPAAEFQEQYLKLKQESEDKVKDVVFKHNASDPNVAKTLGEIDRQTAREQLERQKEDVEAGRARDERVVVSEEVKRKYEENFAAQRVNDIKEVRQAYGEDVAAEFAAIDEAYQREVMENFASGEGRLAVNEKNQAAVEKRNKAVQALLEKAKKDPEVKKKQAARLEAEVKKQNEETISQIMRSDEMREWPSSAKRAYEKQARAVLDEMAKEIAEAAVNAENQQVYEAEARRIQEKAQQKLQRIQVPMGQP